VSQQYTSRPKVSIPSYSLSIYVNDLICTGTNTKTLMEFKEDMMKTFEMTNLGLLSYFLGIEVSKRNDGIFISQKKYT